MKNIKLHSAVLLLLLVALMPSCKSKQTAKLSSETLLNYTVTQVLQQQPQFQTINISKMDVVAVYGTQQLSFRATIKAATDSLLVFSVQPLLGVEMFRVEFTPTSFLIVDKWNRKYTENSYEFLRYKLGVDFNFTILQALLFNQLFVLDGTVSPQQFVVEMEPEEPITLVHLGKNIIQRFELVDKQLSVAKAELIAEKGRLTSTYSDHRLQNGVRFPMAINFSMQIAGKNGTITSQVSRLDFNQPFEYTSINLERYEKVAFSNIIP